VVGPRLAILIPAHREGSTIAEVVARAKAYGTVLVVDDCSPDNTRQQAEAAGAIVVRNDINQGYDRTLSRAFQEADARGFTHAVTMDADGEHDPVCLEAFHRLMFVENVPLVLGYRRRKQRLAEIVMGLYIRLRFGVRDILCGMKGYDLSLLRANDGFDHSDSIGTELAINSLRRGVNFEQVRVTGRPRADAPRFDRRIQANFRIFAALGRVLLQDAGRNTRTRDEAN
jgi:glycosyltransferase involved in cell wall biosynthesis